MYLQQQFFFVRDRYISEQNILFSPVILPRNHLLRLLIESTLNIRIFHFGESCIILLQFKEESNVSFQNDIWPIKMVVLDHGDVITLLITA